MEGLRLNVLPLGCEFRECCFILFDIIFLVRGAGVFDLLPSLYTITGIWSSPQDLKGANITLLSLLVNNIVLQCYTIKEHPIRITCGSSPP